MKPESSGLSHNGAVAYVDFSKLRMKLHGIQIWVDIIWTHYQDTIKLLWSDSPQ